VGFSIAAVATIVFLVLLLAGDWQGSQRAVVIFKPLASTAFVLAGYLALGEASPYAIGILVGLGFSWWGDVLLIPKDSPAVFRLGILAFLLGHVAYSVAFLARGVDPMAVLGSLLVLTLAAGIVLRWLLPHTPDDMRAPVFAYIVVISTMVAFAVGTWSAHGLGSIVVGATMFYLSDLSVAMDRFVRRTFINRLWGLPCYFIAQLVLAWTIAHAG